MEAYKNRGAALHGKGDYDGAVADCTMALKLYPRYAEAYNNRGAALYGKGDYDEAIADYTKAVDLDRSNVQAWMNTGLLFVRLGKEAEAQACFAEGLKINPGLRSALKDKIDQVRAERQALLGETQAGK